MPTQIFRLHTTFTDGDADADTITNWESADDIEPEAPFNGSGTAVISDHTNGIFEFSTTGFYLVQATFLHSNPSAAVTRPDCYSGIQAKRANDNWYLMAKCFFSLDENDLANKYTTSSLNAIIDVTSTSAHKIRFVVYGTGNTVHCLGDGNANYSHAIFSRLGDT